MDQHTFLQIMGGIFASALAASLSERKRKKKASIEPDCSHLPPFSPGEAIATASKLEIVGSCWDILGIRPTTDIWEIKKAYRKLIKEHHPDRAEDKEEAHWKTIRIGEAYREATKTLLP